MAGILQNIFICLGYAFVEFSSVSEAEAAKKRDNELVKGRPIYISDCDPDRKNRISTKSLKVILSKRNKKGLQSEILSADCGIM